MIGIYVIENKVNGKRYVGQSRNIVKRISQHMNRLSKNKEMQMDKEELGISSFNYSVLEICEIDNLSDREKHYVELLKPEYNQRNNFHTQKIKDETRKKMKESAFKRMGMNNQIYDFIASGEKNRFKKRRVLATNVESGESIEFSSLYEAQQKIGAPKSSIHQVINGTRKKTRGFYFRYLD